MSKQRAKKQVRKSVELEQRVEDCEKKITMIMSKTDLSAYNYLVRQIGQMGMQQQELIKSIQLQQEYIKEIGKYDEFQKWLETKMKELEEQRKASQQPPQKPERPKSEAERKLEQDKGVIKTVPTKPPCKACNGRGYVGDNEECPACHPNKNPPKEPELTAEQEDFISTPKEHRDPPEEN